MSDLTLGSLVAECDEPANGLYCGTLVMIHGLGGSSNTFQSLMPALGDYRVLRVDMPGAARSAVQPGRASIQALAAAILDLLRSVRVTRCHLIGHSLGTLVCQSLAAGNALEVESLVLFGPMLAPPAAARQALRERAESVLRSGMAGVADAVSRASVGPAAAHDPVVGAYIRESLMRQSPTGYAAHCRALADAGPADHAAIRCPSRLVVGSADPVTPPAMARELVTRLPSATLDELDGVGHWATLEAPDAARRSLLQHLSLVDAAGCVNHHLPPSTRWQESKT